MAKLWSLASVAIGAVIGAPLGLWYAHSLIRQGCSQAGASNLCGLTTAPAVPFYIAIGAVAGASVAAFAVVLILRMRRV